jgi:hypothetical protein
MPDLMESLVAPTAIELDRSTALDNFRHRLDPFAAYIDIEYGDVKVGRVMLAEWTLSDDRRPI